MFQSFDVQGGPHIGRANLPRLRAAMKAAGLDGLIIPHEDEYQNEYLPDANERLAWATGFTGSAGAAVVRAHDAVVFVDGRYTLQAASQLDAALFQVADLVAPGVAAWLRQHAAKGERYGYDPRLHSPRGVTPLAEALADAGASLAALTENPVDQAWTDRPALPSAPISPHPLAHSGETHADKRTRLAADLEAQGLDAAVITEPASIAWLLNVRGGDVRCTPLPLARAILNEDATVELFVAPEKLTDEATAHLGNAVRVHQEDAFGDHMATLSGKRVLLDPASASAWTFSLADEAGVKIERGADPCALPRACKNPVEVDGARVAHRRDGVAVSRFLHWLSVEGASGETHEIDAVVALENFRRDTGALRDISFESISGAGPNGAIVHYRVNTATNRRLKRGQLFLVDSGGQYLEGTTDITRTVAIGRPSREMRERYTLVLQGHIALSAVRFPVGVVGAHLDALARQPLWRAGLDYDHGTGHGVGSFLGVHEGPQRIAKALHAQPLLPGMIVSNEPGYYKEGAYGIRIENLQVVTPPSPVEGGEREMLGFETLTLAPLERALIVKTMLTRQERTWIDDYHARVLEEIGGQLSGDAAQWLEQACAPL